MNLHTPCDVSLASNEVRYRSAHPTESQSGGDDPIRTDGAFRGHSALAVRCLVHSATSPRISWWGWRDLNSHARRRWFLRPVSPISTTSPLLTNSAKLRYTSSDQVLEHKPVDDMVRLPIPPEAQSKSPSIFEGLLRFIRTLPKSAAPLHVQQIAEVFGQIRVE